MIIKAENITKSFGNLQVLKGVDFHASEAEVVAIMGASGAGKSTLLQILGTLSTPDGGSLEIDGTDVLSLGSKALADFRNHRIGFVFQAHHLLPEFSALENVMIPSLIAGKSSREARERASELLKTVGLEGRMGHKPSELSGGELSRVAIARALQMNPAIVFADEPTGNLDPQTSEEIMNLFVNINHEYQTTLLISTHDYIMIDKFKARLLYCENHSVLEPNKIND